VFDQFIPVGDLVIQVSDGVVFVCLLLLILYKVMSVEIEG
jgi:hypothetical protein